MSAETNDASHVRNEFAWTCLDPSAQLWAAEYRVPGFRCRTVAAPLKSGGWVLLSPGGSLVDTLPEEMTRRGKVELLLLPNSYHHMGIDAWLARDPQLRVCAAEGAIGRVARQHPGVSIQRLEAVHSKLAPQVTLLELPATRIGEVWLRFQGEHGVSWAVGDAFFNIPKLPSSIPQRLIFQLLGSAPGLRMSHLFKYGGIQKQAPFKEWVLAQLDRDNPVRLVPNHGGILADGELGHGQVVSRLRELVDARL